MDPQVTALENYVDQAQRTVEAGGLFTLAALGSLARCPRPSRGKGPIRWSPNIDDPGMVSKTCI